MTSSSLPPAVPLARERRSADEPALVRALPELTPAVQAATLAVLIERPDSPVLHDLVARFQGFAKGFQAIILQHVEGLHAALGGAIRSSAVEARLSAIALIARSQSGKDAHLLAEALRSSCPTTRQRASLALREMTALVVDSTDTYSSEARPSGSAQTETRPSGSVQTETRPSGSETPHSPETFLADALAAAVLGWELHFRPEVLEAALWLGGKVEWAIRKKLQEPRTRIAHPLSNQLSRAADPRLAGFVLRALAIPELRPSAARAIERAKDPSFIRALASQAWLLADPEIERGCRWIRELRWLGTRSEELLAFDGPQAAGAARLLGATVGAPKRKMEPFGEPAADLQPPADPLIDVRARFARAKPLERLEALRTVRDRGLTGEFAEQVYRLAHDPAAVVRSSAVAMLAELPTATSRRILRAALDDPDVRVQVGAIEALDVLGVKDRAAQIESKLQSQSSRVRASAVKSLLPLEVRKAGEVLLDMLEDSSSAHRLGALWVIERLELHAAVHRVSKLCLVDSVERVRQNARRVVSVLTGDSDSPPDGTVPYGWSAQREGDGP